MRRARRRPPRRRCERLASTSRDEKERGRWPPLGLCARSRRALARLETALRPGSRLPTGGSREIRAHAFPLEPAERRSLDFHDTPGSAGSRLTADLLQSMRARAGGRRLLGLHRRDGRRSEGLTSEPSLALTTAP